jgi:hypothetical protein
LFPPKLPDAEDRRILGTWIISALSPAVRATSMEAYMKEFDTEQAPYLIRALGDSEIETVSGGEVKITGQAYIPFVGTFLWFDNGGLSFMGDDFLVINSHDLP